MAVEEVMLGDVLVGLSAFLDWSAETLLRRASLLGLRKALSPPRIPGREVARLGGCGGKAEWGGERVTCRLEGGS